MEAVSNLTLLEACFLEIDPGAAGETPNTDIILLLLSFCFY